MLLIYIHELIPTHLGFLKILHIKKPFILQVETIFTFIGPFYSAIYNSGRRFVGMGTWELVLMEFLLKF